MLGVLIAVLSLNGISVANCGTRQRDIALIVALGIARGVVLPGAPPRAAIAGARRVAWPGSLIAIARSMHSFDLP
jgi:hypothetical protein